MGLIARRLLTMMGGAQWVVPTDIPAAEAAALKWLYDNTNGADWTTKTNWGKTATANDWHGITVAGGKVTIIALDDNNLVGNVGSWNVAAFTGLQTLQIFSNASLVGDTSSWPLPAALLALYLRNTGLSGGGWTIPATLKYAYVYSAAFSGAPDFSVAAAIRDFRYQDNGLSQADVDATLAAIYARRASFTYAAPALLIGSDNAAPSGTYQDGDPPTTGLEYVYELANDPETEGFNTWTISYNGGSAP